MRTGLFERINDADHALGPYETFTVRESMSEDEGMLVIEIKQGEDMLSWCLSGDEAKRLAGLILGHTRGEIIFTMAPTTKST